MNNINKVIHYYFLSASHNYIGAHSSLTKIYYDTCVKQNIQKTIHFNSLTTKQNNLQAQNCLGVIFEDKDYVEQDIEKAFHYYSLAAFIKKHYSILVYFNADGEFL